MTEFTRIDKKNIKREDIYKPADADFEIYLKEELKLKGFYGEVTIAPSKKLPPGKSYLTYNVENGLRLTSYKFN
jgi:hypothetical protein